MEGTSDATEQPQRYTRDVDPDGLDSISRLARRIAPGTEVLDLGCGPGALGRYLRRAKDCRVDGVELDPRAAAEAARHYRTVEIVDLEAEPLAARFGERRYDYIVCADVLEHLRDPSALAAQLPSLLKPTGKILLSLPNVGYAGLVGALMNGEFEYRDSGLLDSTHLRFFTRRSLWRWLAENDLEVVGLETVTMPLASSEFDELEGLPPSSRRALLAMPDALTYQFIVETTPGRGPQPTGMAEELGEAAFTYTARLHCRVPSPGAAVPAIAVRGRVGVDRQRLAFPIPPQRLELATLRLSPADRAGFLRVHEISLLDAQRQSIWRWDPQQQIATTASHGVHVVRDEDVAAGQLLAVVGDDAWLELPIPREQLVSLRQGGTLEVELGWPQSPDAFLVLRRLLRGDGQIDRIAEISAERDALRARVEMAADARATLEALTEDMRGHIRTLNHEIAAMQKELRAAHAKIEKFDRSLTHRLARPVYGIMDKLRRP